MSLRSILDSGPGMPSRTTRSLKHEYSLFLEQEIENYKESIPRSAILAIGDEAAGRLSANAQFSLTEMLLCEEVDRIISRRLRLPAFSTWRKKRIKLHQEMRRPEHWGLTTSDALVRTIGGGSGMLGHVLLAGETAARSALFLVANGCDVTAVELAAESVQRVMEAAVQAGLSDRFHALPNALTQWTPEGPLHVVVCSHAAIDGLAPRERARVLAALQSATMDGGVHLVETILAGSAIDELRATYDGWDVSVEPSGSSQVFLARKELAH
ncbi:MAG TPA: hypothetical protein VF483_01345 [Gemmatimonadaceae bacterium]